MVSNVSIRALIVLCFGGPSFAENGIGPADDRASARSVPLRRWSVVAHLQEYRRPMDLPLAEILLLHPDDVARAHKGPYRPGILSSPLPCRVLVGRKMVVAGTFRPHARSTQDFPVERPLRRLCSARDLSPVPPLPKQRTSHLRANGRLGRRAGGARPALALLPMRGQGLRLDRDFAPTTARQQSPLTARES